MLGRLADILVIRRRVVLALTGVVMVLAAVFGLGVAGHLSAGGFTDPGNESSKAEQVLNDTFRQGPPNFILLVHAPQGIDDPASATAGRELTARLAAERG